MSSLLVSNFTSDSSFKLVAESWWKCGEIEFNFLKDLALQSYKSAHCNKVGSATTERNVGLWAFRSCLVVKCYIYALNGKGIFVWKSMVGGLWKLYTILFTVYAVESLGINSAELGPAINSLIHISEGSHLKVYRSIWTIATDHAF